MSKLLKQFNEVEAPFLLFRYFQYILGINKLQWLFEVVLCRWQLGVAVESL